MIPYLAALGLALLLLLVGSRFSGLLTATGDGALQRTVVHWMAGMVVFHLLLTLLDFTGLRWPPAVLLISLSLLAILAHRFLPQSSERGPERAKLPSDLGWGDELALFTLAVFALIALTLWITTPDFVYHWGLKGQRFFIVRHVDYTWLARSWQGTIHPDYPNLLPELYAASSLLARRFDPPALMLWSALFFGMMLAAAREALGRAGASSFVRQAGVAVLSLAVAAFALRHQMAGGADWMLALALLAAIPPLLRPPDPEGDLQIGVAAAFAAASKVEGVALAGFLVLAQMARRAPGRRWISWQRLLRLGLPAAAVVIPWYVQVRRYRLFGVLNADRFDWGRAGVIFPVMRDIVLGPWHGFALVVFLLPLLALRRQTRPLALAAGGQLLFYLWIYFTSGFDTRFYVASSFPRLLLHLVPAVMVGVLLAPSPGPSPAVKR